MERHTAHQNLLIIIMEFHYSLANLNSNDKYGVFELGMSSKGEIDNLVNLVRPHIAIITNIGPAHIRKF